MQLIVTWLSQPKEAETGMIGGLNIKGSVASPSHPNLPIDGQCVLKSTKEQHKSLNTNIFLPRTHGRAKTPTQKEPCGLSREDEKQPDGIALIEPMTSRLTAPHANHYTLEVHCTLTG